MDEIIAKMKELETLVKAHSDIVTACEVSNGILGTSILMKDMKDVPTYDGTTYRKTNSGSLPYKKETVIDGIKVGAWGTQEDMKNEVA